MIVTLRSGLGLHVIEAAIRFFQERGCDVMVSTDEGSEKDIVLAVIGAAAERIDLTVSKPFGVKKFIKENKFFFDHHDSFVEAWQYVSQRERLTSLAS